MKGASNVIFVVVAIILGILVLAISMGMLKTTNQGFKNQEERSKEFVKSLDTDTLEMACRELTSGKTYNYKADVFLEQLKIPELLKALPNIWERCGSKLETVAFECYKNTPSATTENCNGNYIKVTSLKSAFSICKNLFTIKTLCEQRCPDQVNLCIYTILDNNADKICNGENLNLNTEIIDSACSG